MSQAQAQSRRANNSFNIPRAPPLPPSKPLQRARDAASRLLGYPSLSTSPLGETEDDERYVRASSHLMRYPVLSVNQNASTTHKTGLEINTIAINGRGTHAVIGGKDIFRTIRVEEGRCAEDFNLRTAIRGNPKTAAGQPRSGNPNIDVSDVAWAQADFGDYIAAATTSGKIVLYNMARADLQPTQLHEHARQVHRVTFNPHKSNYLLSGSQDGTVRLWDLRDARNQVAAIRSKRIYTGHKSPVRDVKWSPTEGLDFACGTDDGDIQRWDLRDLRAPKAKISAHGLGCNAVDWHPDGTHIMGASSDGTVRVFDISQSRPKKALWEIKAPYAVMNARWRPACESLTLTDKCARLCTQFVTSYDREHPVVHLWDFRRPHLPFRQIEPYGSAPTDLIWHSQDLIWMVGREGTFVQTDVQHVPKVIDRRSLQTMSVSSQGEMSVLNQRREQKRALRPSPQGSGYSSTLKNSPNDSPENSLVSRSWGDDSLDQSFLAIMPFKKGIRTSSYSKNTAAFNSPSNNQSSTSILRLDDTLLKLQSSRPLQIAFHGKTSRLNTRKFLQNFAKRSLNTTIETPGETDLLENMKIAIEQNALLAEEFGLRRLSRTWKLFEYWVSRHLRRREAAKRSRIKVSPNHQRNSQDLPVFRHTAFSLIRRQLGSHHTGSASQSPLSIRPQSMLAKHLAIHESTSNVPTPLARPLTSHRLTHASHEPSLPDPDQEDQIALPPSLVNPPINLTSPPVVEVATSPSMLTVENLSDLHRLREMEEQASPAGNPIERWRSIPNGRLNVDLVDPAGLSKRPKLEKHDSDESFHFLVGSTDSGDTSLPASLGSSGSHKAKQDLVAERPSRAKSNDKEPVVEQGSDQVVLPQAQVRMFEGSGTLERSTTTALTDSRIVDSEEQTNILGIEDEKHDVTSEGRNPRPEFHVQGHGSRETAHEVNQDTASNGLSQRTQKVDSARAQKADVDPDIYRVKRNAPLEPVSASIRPPVSSKARSYLDSGMSVLSSPPTKLGRELDVDVEQGNAIILIDLLREQIRHYTIEQPSAYISSILLLLIGPILPRTHPLPPSVIRATLDRYVEYFTAHLDLDHEDLTALLTACYDQPVKAGLQPLQTESVLSTYHEQLLSLRLWNEAAHLRNLAYPAYPAVYEDFLDGSDVRFKCGTCGQLVTTTPLSSMPVLNHGGLRCDHCARDPQRGCAVCELPRSPYEGTRKLHGPKTGLYSSCLSCHHSGHAACYRRWFADEGGTGCPTIGCLCLCGEIGRK